MFISSIIKNKKELLEDLTSRFLLNLPEKEYKDWNRILIQIRQAQYFFLDFYQKQFSYLNEFKNFRSFASEIIAFITKKEITNDIFDYHQKYLRSIPTYGSILLNKNKDKVLLAKQITGGWTFPRGKVDEDELDSDCAIRETYEETNFNISNFIDNNKFINKVVNGKDITLYVIDNVPENFDFKSNCKYEVSQVEWFEISKINKSFTFDVLPFLSGIYEHIKKDDKPTENSISKNNLTFGSDTNGWSVEDMFKINQEKFGVKLSTKEDLDNAYNKLFYDKVIKEEKVVESDLKYETSLVLNEIINDVDIRNETSEVLNKIIDEVSKEKEVIEEKKEYTNEQLNINKKIIEYFENKNKILKRYNDFLKSEIKIEVNKKFYFNQKKFRDMVFKYSQLQSGDYNNLYVIKLLIPIINYLVSGLQKEITEKGNNNKVIVDFLNKVLSSSENDYEGILIELLNLKHLRDEMYISFVLESDITFQNNWKYLIKLMNTHDIQLDLIKINKNFITIIKDYKKSNLLDSPIPHFENWDILRKFIKDNPEKIKAFREHNGIIAKEITTIRKDEIFKQILLINKILDEELYYIFLFTKNDTPEEFAKILFQVENNFVPYIVLFFSFTGKNRNIYQVIHPHLKEVTISFFNKTINTPEFLTAYQIEMSKKPRTKIYETFKQILIDLKLKGK